MADDYEYHPVVLASDVTDMQAGTLARISDAAQFGAPAAAISGALSIWNTVLDYSGQEALDVEQTIRQYDEQAGDYYAEHKDAADITGFVAASLLPGSLGMKGLQLARTGNVLGATSRALALPSTRRAHYLREALKEVGEDGGIIPNLLSAKRRKQLGWDVAENALQGLSAELAIAATMHDSSVFDGDTYGDFGWNIALGTVLGGGIGAGLGALTSGGILKRAGSEVEKRLRLSDTVFDPKNLDLLKGTEAWLMSKSMTELLDDAGTLKYGYKFDGKAQEIDLDLSSVSAAARERATKLGTSNLQLKFNQLAEGNASVGQAYYDFIKDAGSSLKAAGKSDDEVLQTLHGWLANVKAVRSLDLEKTALDARSFYVDLHPTGATDAEKVANIFSLKRKPTAKDRYYLADDIAQSDVVIKDIADFGGTSIAKTFKANPDVDMLRLMDGTIRVNPNSAKVLKNSELPTEYRQFVDLETGTLASETVPRFGDIIGAKGAKIASEFVEAGGKTFRQAAYVPYASVADPLNAGARYAWASGLEPAALIRLTGNRINTDDLPVLARLIELQPQIAEDTLRKMKFIDNGQERVFDDYVSLQQLLDTKRYELLQKDLAEWATVSGKGSVPDVRVFAAKLNTSADWVETAIARGFRAPGPKEVSSKVFTTEEAMRPKSAEVVWDFRRLGANDTPEHAYMMNMGPMHLMSKQLAATYQLKMAEVHSRQAAASVLGEYDELFMTADKLLARETNSQGAGASLLGASNAGYGERAKLFVQDTGKNVALASQAQADSVVNSLASQINAIRDTPRAAAELGILTTALRKSPHRFQFDTVAGSKRIVSQEAVSTARRLKLTIDEAVEYLNKQDVNFPHSFTIQSDGVVDFLKQATKINDTRQAKTVTLANAMGVTKTHNAGTIYVPPVNTVKYPYHAFVRSKEKVGLASDVTMITAKNEEQLRELAGQVGDDFDVLFDRNTEKYFKAKGEYDYQMTLNESSVNSTLARKGKLADFFPETRAENVLQDWVEFQVKQEERLIRTAVQVKNRRFFSEMQGLSEQYRQVSESVTRGIGSRFKSKVADPYGDYIKTALNVSKQQEFPLLDSLNDFVDKIGMKAGDAIAKGFRDAQAGLLPWEDANKIMKDYGMGGMYNNAETYLVANERYPRNVIRETVQKANLFLATTLLRLDFANSLLNIISTPIMLGTEMQSIKGLIAGDAALAGKLAELQSIKVPGRNVRAPSTTKLIAESIGDFFGPEKNKLLARYRDIGAVKDVSQLYHEVLDDLAYHPGSKIPEWKSRVDAAVEKGAKLTGNTLAEDFTRFVSANVMKKLSDPIVQARKMTIREQNAYISTFVNRVQGNYVTSQRPVVFQGTTGAAISLFQTYAFNVLQQLHRHVQAGDKKTAAMFAGLQGSVFGLNGLPFFDAANTYIIGSAVANNPEHHDAYSVLPGMNKELGDWMLYGTASAFPLFTGSMPALYTRGDINPRHPTLVPTNIEDVPAVAASIKLVDTLTGFYKNVAGGADMSDAGLQALMHQGLNRPLAGFAQLMAGYSTTNSGALVSASNDLATNSWLMNMKDRVVDYNGVPRLMGARPMDEAVALNQLYRNKTYEALDRARIERLGQVVKSKLRANRAPEVEEMEDFMLRYTRAGGDVQNFSKAMQRWSRDANTSVVNQTMQRANSPYANKLKTIMGGEPLADFRNQDQAPQADSEYVE